MAKEHWHQCSELLYMFGGTASQVVNSTSITLNPNDCLLIYDGDIHSTSAVTEDCYIAVVQFRSPCPLGSLYLPADKSTPELARIFTLLNKEYTLKAPGYQTMIQGLLFQALGWLERLAQPLPDSVPLTAEAMRIAEYIQNHILEGVSLAGAAEFAGYSPTYFSRHFQKLMGISFRSYTEEIRMRTAKKMLLAGYPVSEVAQTLLSPDMLRKYVFPWHKKIVEAAHKNGKPAVLHSCGYMVEIMEDIIEDMKYDGKHSYEDNIVPVEEAYQRWGGRIAILGGLDVDFLIRSENEEIVKRAKNMLEITKEKGGYALGSGNSIPEYIPNEKYFAMTSAIVL